MLSGIDPVRWAGVVVRATETLVESTGPMCRIGDVCQYGDESSHLGEVVGLQGRRVLSVPFKGTDNISCGTKVYSRNHPPSINVGYGLIGRVVDPDGAPIDGKGSLRTDRRVVLEPTCPSPFERDLIDTRLTTGVRAIDSFVTCGIGQRIGIFGGSGVGKSTLIGMMTRNSAADVIIVALVGERGREVKELIQTIGNGMERAVVVASTSNEAPLMRVRAALAATSISEFFAAQGKTVLLVVDSLTRFAMAHREISLSLGEMPTARGYTPSVFLKLAKLLERAGRFSKGSITGFYSVLMEGDDQQEILVDTARSILDGHVVLSRDLAAAGHYPPIDVVSSLSRLAGAVCDREHLSAAGQLRAMLALLQEKEDIVRIGAYTPGADPMLDRALSLKPQISSFLKQSADEKSDYESMMSKLLELSRGA